MTGSVTTETLVAALNREPIELADGVTPEEVMRLALDGIDIAYRAHGDRARVSLLAVQADWIMQHLARTEAWAKDEQTKRHAAEDKLVEARSCAALAEASLQQVTAERDEARDLAYELKLAAAGGEDVPGSANLVTPEDVRRWRDEDTRQLATATSELARLQAEGEAKDRALKILLPFVDYAAGEGLMFRGSDDTDRPDMDAADLCIAAAAALGLELGDPGYCALVEQGEQEITALARAATAREGA